MKMALRMIVHAKKWSKCELLMTLSKKVRSRSSRIFCSLLFARHLSMSFISHTEEAFDDAFVVCFFRVIPEKRDKTVCLVDLMLFLKVIFVLFDRVVPGLFSALLSRPSLRPGEASPSCFGGSGSGWAFTSPETLAANALFELMWLSLLTAAGLDCERVLDSCLTAAKPEWKSPLWSGLLADVGEHELVPWSGLVAAGTLECE
mmetsp:Transcript_117270/g.311942  ORF Transcript_117270/g.311942 Transcript_117270/m.311942 type:complete len:203 (+) Transcript_117270:1169-1777(+)